MDKIDKKILSNLDKDPRIPLTKLAKQVRISQQVAEYRMKRFIKEKIITKLATIINLKALHLEHYRLFFTCNTQNTFTNKEIFSYLQQRKGVYWAARIGGKYDLHITLFVYNFEELDSFLDEFNKRFPKLIKDTLSCYVLEHHMYNHKFLSPSNKEIRYGYNDSYV